MGEEWGNGNANNTFKTTKRVKSLGGTVGTLEGSNSDEGMMRLFTQGFGEKEEAEVDLKKKATAKLNREGLLLIINTKGLAVATANVCTKRTSTEGTENNPKAAEILDRFVSANFSCSVRMISPDF